MSSRISRPQYLLTPQRQRGMLTMVISLVLLTLSTLVTINLSRAILMEQRIANNDARARQAFEAAEAGMNAALVYLDNDPDVNLDGVIDPVFDTNADGIGDSNSSTIGSGSVTVTTTSLSVDLTSVLISSQGFSDDGSATRTITQTLVTINPLPNMPQNPLVVRGSVIISGSATVHNPEGLSTIWSGADIDLGSNNTTSTEVPDIGDPGYPACMDVAMTCELVRASNRLIAGVDIIENDSSLSSLSSDQFFQNFFGVSPSTYRSAFVTVDTTPAAANADVQLATHEVIWIDGDVTLSNVTVGCRLAVSGSNVCLTANTKPSIVIVNGNASFIGTPQFYGLLFVRGDVTGGGNITVHGAMVIGGNNISSAGGSLDIWYSSDVLEGTAKAGSTTGSAGTWRDF